jgi:hypothetical protein
LTSKYRNPFPSVPLWPSGLRTTTSTVPALLRAPVVAVSDVPPDTLSFVASTPPTISEAPLLKFEPVTVTAVPPTVFPDVGLIEDTAGAGPIAVVVVVLIVTSLPPQAAQVRATIANTEEICFTIRLLHSRE